jgi:hypothetical protein
VRVLLAILLLVGVAAQAQAKKFRHYYGMQWEFEETELPSQPILARAGEVIFQTRLLPTALFTLDDDFVVGGKTIIGKGTQLAPAVSSKSIRCTLGPGVAGSLSYDRRVCLVDLDKDGGFDAYFDEGLGMEMAQMQFTGCMPTDPAKAVAPTMSQISPDQTRWSFAVTITLGMYKIRKNKPAEFRFDVIVKRDDKPSLRFVLCEQGYLCRWTEGTQLQAPGDLAFRAYAKDATYARIEVDQPFQRTGFYDMRPAHRPDPVYCPGTLFVKTDQHGEW